LCLFHKRTRKFDIGSKPSLPLPGRACKGEEAFLIVAGGTANHIHLLIALPAAVSLAKAVQDLKGNSSRWMNEHGSSFAWQEGYGAFSVSASNRRAVMAYIAEQPRHHEKRSFEEEFTILLSRSGVNYDPNFVFG
jgi:hypothetical protein